MAKIDFVCDVPMDDATIAKDLPPVELPPLLTSMTDIFTAPGQPNPAPSQPNIIANNVIPPDTPLQSPPENPEYPPVYYPGPPTIFGGGPYYPPTPPISQTPEPASLILMTTAFGLLSGLVFWKRHRSLVENASYSS
jgi:hypothetical protein